MEKQVKQAMVNDRPHFIRFVRTLKEFDINEASRKLSVSRRTIFNYESGSVAITDKIFNHVIGNYEVTDYEIRVYLEYYECVNCS